MADEPSPRTRFFADVLSFGWTLPASLAAGAGLGWLADRLLGTSPVLTIALALVGAAGGLWQVYKEMNRLAEEKGGGPPPGPE